MIKLPYYTLFIALIFSLISCNDKSPSNDNGTNNPSLLNKNIENVNDIKIGKDTIKENTNVVYLNDSISQIKKLFFDTIIQCNNSDIEIKINKTELIGKYYNSLLDNRFEIIVEQRDSIIFTESLGKESFEVSDKYFIDRAILHKLYFESIECFKNKITIFAILIIPETDYAYTFYLNINYMNNHLSIISE